MKKTLSVILSVLMAFSAFAVMPVSASAFNDGYPQTADFANQWSRSDLRAWLNGLTKTNGNLPLDGSNGVKSSKNFLNNFTDAELALFQPQTVVTNVFNDAAALDSNNADQALTRTTSVVETKDRFWAASGLLMRKHVTAYEDQLVSVDPSYDLSDYYTYQQKVNNGKDTKWRNIVPIAFWAGTGAYYDSMSLRSASYEDVAQVLGSDSGYSIEGHDIDDSWESAQACGKIALPSDVFAAVANSADAANGEFRKVEIAGYNKLGKNNRSDCPPSWGIYLKNITLENISGSLAYNDNDHTLTFTSDNALPQNKYLMIQVYKNWDYSKETDEEGTRAETQNARIGETLFVSDKQILNDNTTSVAFTLNGNEISDLSGCTVKVWTEQSATAQSPAQASSPLTFVIDGNGAAIATEENKSLNPRVFAYKSDLSCSWGVYNNEQECTFISHGEAGFNYDTQYNGVGATYQKLYIGTKDGKPIEWWIAGREGDMLTLYQCSGIEVMEFNEDTYNYEDDVKNPSLYLASDFDFSDIEDFATKITLTKRAIAPDDASFCDEDDVYSGSVSTDDDNILIASADNYSLQFCETNASSWTDSLSGEGTYYVRVAFAGETINGVEYAPCFSNVRKITFKKLTPAYTVPENLSATYGDLLSGVALPSGWSWEDGTQAVGGAGDNAFSATFTPENTAYYNTVTEQLTVAVAPKKITVNVDSKESPQGAWLAELTYTLDGEIVSGDDLGITLSTQADPDVPGEYEITATGSNTNYDLTVNKGVYKVLAKQEPQPEPVKPAKKKNPIKVKGKKVKIAFAKLSAAKRVIKRKKAITVKGAKGKVTYKLAKKNKNFKVSKSGKITVKKGLKKGTYKVKIKVTAKGNAAYKAATKTVTVKIIVK